MGYCCFVPDGTLSRATLDWLSSSLLVAKLFALAGHGPRATRQGRYNYSPRFQPRGMVKTKLSPVKGDTKLRPEVRFVVLNFVLLQKGCQLFLERNSSMVFLLSRDVLAGLLESRTAHAERGEPALPTKVAASRQLLMYSPRRAALDVTHQVAADSDVGTETSM